MSARWVIWVPGLAVAVGAAVATAHGLYEVAVAAKVPEPIAWLYPLITDGLALVAYTATARLAGSAARYAWAVVVLAAGLSGLAQAMFLASDPAPGGPVPGAVPGAVVGPVFEASAALRFGVGAWPAIAAAIVAHLLYLLATEQPPPRSSAESVPGPVAGVQVPPFNPSPVQQDRPGAQSLTVRPVQPAQAAPVQPSVPVGAPSGRPALSPAPVEQPGRGSGGSPVRERARAAAMRHAAHHGHLPTVSELEEIAEVSRGTASAALKHLREHPAPLHLITNTDQTDPGSPDVRTQP